MAFENPGDGALNYDPCRYGASKLLFRGPRRRLEGRFAVFFGSSETYGKYIERPFPELVGDRMGMRTVNMGCVNAGIDAYQHDAFLQDVAGKAQVAVIQVMGAANLSNRFYSVHPRRNDRFIKPSALMRTLYRDLDFSEITFTQHLLRSLEEHCPRSYALVVDELKAAWVARMRSWLGSLDCHTVLLWLADHAPGEGDGSSDPRFIDRKMLAEITPLVDRLVEVVYPVPAEAEPSDGLVFSELEAPAAVSTPGVSVHEAVAEALVPALQRIIA
ncbi:DUF6473 family protein [Tropicimonas isoalkanivorans]|uniref:DUF6473 domain-containing protein n=1 Tax=Tropicimonas isoalkanivorans TaxID=441112 RepID=A0A1I1PC22_9RHOB|nr:DUF6473 family protein [Tropicimonas isoalkanivorans]SFD07256.1 hypothetical protein SAMN04488094_114112 [Tropicimonas isoalkanivorans]